MAAVHRCPHRPRAQSDRVPACRPSVARPVAVGADRCPARRDGLHQSSPVCRSGRRVKRVNAGVHRIVVALESQGRTQKFQILFGDEESVKDGILAPLEIKSLAGEALSLAGLAGKSEFDDFADGSAQNCGKLLDLTRSEACAARIRTRRLTFSARSGNSSSRSTPWQDRHGVKEGKANASQRVDPSGIP
jgi:hypothetical protein